MPACFCIHAHVSAIALVKILSPSFFQTYIFHFFSLWSSPELSHSRKLFFWGLGGFPAGINARQQSCKYVLATRWSTRTEVLRQWHLEFSIGFSWSFLMPECLGAWWRGYQEGGEVESWWGWGPHKTSRHGFWWNDSLFGWVPYWI